MYCEDRRKSAFNIVIQANKQYTYFQSLTWQIFLSFSFNAFACINKLFVYDLRERLLFQRTVVFTSSDL